jgi:predicted  nucleic acid-binding Zn-ribbon protein
MSGNDRADLRAFRELEGLVRNLGEELAVFRRRAVTAETQLNELGQSHPAKGSAVRGAAGEHASDLERENHVLRTRLERAEDRVRQMMDRVRFLRQQLQAQTGAPGVGAGR